MSTSPRGSKRKASEALVPANAVPDVSKPRNLAKTMLAWLPRGSNMQSKETKDLLLAFGYVQAELHRRTSRMAKKNLTEGKKSDITLNGVTVAPDVFHRVLEFLPVPDLVLKAGMVSKSWLVASREPKLYHTIDAANGFKYHSKKLHHMAEVFQLLKRPHFASLKRLLLPARIQYRNKAFDHIAKICPLLQVIDVGYCELSAMRIDDKGLESLPALFPHLKVLRLGMEKVSAAGLMSFCQRMGDRLQVLTVRERIECHSSVNDTVLAVVAQHCPNLTEFHFMNYWTNLRVTSTGLISLFTGCKGLKRFSLAHRVRPRYNNWGRPMPFTEQPVDVKDGFRFLAQQDDIELTHVSVIGIRSVSCDEGLCLTLSDKIEFFEAPLKDDDAQFFDVKKILKEGIFGKTESSKPSTTFGEEEEESISTAQAPSLAGSVELMDEDMDDE